MEMLEILPFLQSLGLSTDGILIVGMLAWILRRMGNLIDRREFEDFKEQNTREHAHTMERVSHIEDKVEKIDEEVHSIKEKQSVMEERQKIVAEDVRSIRGRQPHHPSER